MEDLQKKHRQEQKDLQSRITQKKKSATKKTRKGVNEECEELERKLKEKQACELALLTEEGQEDEPSPGPENLETPSPDPSLDDIQSHMTSVSINNTPVSNGHIKKPNRQKARLARRAAEQDAAVEEAEKEAANLPNLQESERESMRQAYCSEGLEEHEIRSDGHCLYAAVADQLTDLGISLTPKIDLGSKQGEITSRSVNYQITREVAAAYITQNSDDFLPFLEEPLESYVKTIRETGEWGGHVEILALAKAYGVNINVLQGDGKVERIESRDSSTVNSLWLAYYRHRYGLGEHYNSLRRAPREP